MVKNKAPLAPESGSLGDRETRASVEETAASVRVAFIQKFHHYSHGLIDHLSAVASGRN